MDDTAARLEVLFASVFPELKPEEIRQATEDSVEKWDSMASVTIISLACEEFGVELNMDDFEQFTSFRTLLKYIESVRPNA